MQPPTRAEKGKANVGPQTLTGIIAPPMPVATIPDDITLEDDPDVIELDDEILDRYLAITAPRPPAVKSNNGAANHQVAPPKPPQTRPLLHRKPTTGSGSRVRFAIPLTRAT